MIAALAQLAHERVIIAFHVLDSSPCEVGGIHAGESGEVAPVDQCGLYATTRERRSRDRAIDPSADDQYIKGSLGELVYIASTELHFNLFNAYSDASARK